MKRFIILFLTLCILVSVMHVLAEEQITISFDTEQYTVPVNQTLSLKAIVTPRKNIKLEWSSSDESVATISNNGAVKGINIGETTITVKAADDDSIAASCQITVIQPVNAISFTDKSIDIAIGISKELHTIVDPENATIKDLSYSSSNEKVAIVDEHGIVTGLSKGTAKITAAAKDGSKKKATVNINVKEYDMVFVSKRPQTTNLSYSGTGNVKIRSSIKNGNVEAKRIDYDDDSWKKIRREIDSDFWMSGAASEQIEVTPVHPGSDEVTIKLNNKKMSLSVFVADYYESSDNQYVPVPDTKPNESNGTFREIIYGTSYADIIDQLTETCQSDPVKKESDSGFSVEFNNPGIDVAGHPIKSLCFYFCFDEDENGYIVQDPKRSAFYKASYVIMETSYEQDFLDDYILSDNSVTEDLYNKLTDIYGKQKTSFDMNDIADGYSVRWEDNQTNIEMEYDVQSAEINLTYTWSPGSLKRSILDDTAEYLDELEDLKKKDVEKVEYDSSIDGL